MGQWKKIKSGASGGWGRLYDFFRFGLLPSINEFMSSPFRLLLVVLCLILVNMGRPASWVSVLSDLACVISVLRCLFIIHQNKKDDRCQAEVEPDDGALRSRVERVSHVPT